MSEKKVMSVAEALRAGTSVDEIRSTFENALKDAQTQIAAEKEAARKAKEKEEKKCGKCQCKEISETELACCREDLIDAVIYYLKAMRIMPEDAEINDEDYDKIVKTLKEVEKEFMASMTFVRLLADLHKNEDKPTEKPDRSNSDDIIAQFLKSLQ